MLDWKQKNSLVLVLFLRPSEVKLNKNKLIAADCFVMWPRSRRLGVYLKEQMVRLEPMRLKTRLFLSIPFGVGFRLLLPCSRPLQLHVSNHFLILCFRPFFRCFRPFVDISNQNVHLWILIDTRCFVMGSAWLSFATMMWHRLLDMLPVNQLFLIIYYSNKAITIPFVTLS